MSTTTTTTQTELQPATASIPCWDHIFRTCAHGNECRYFHPLGLSELQQQLGSDDDPQPHPIVWFTTPCNHFKKSGGCIRGDECRFIHDPQLLFHEELNPFASTGAHHCWAYIQGLCDKTPCKFSHPANKEPFLRYTPCLSWPRCSGSAGGCPFKHISSPPGSPTRRPPTSLPKIQICMVPYYAPPFVSLSPSYTIQMTPTRRAAPSIVPVPLNGMVYYQYC